MDFSNNQFQQALPKQGLPLSMLASHTTPIELNALKEAPSNNMKTNPAEFNPTASSSKKTQGKLQLKSKHEIQDEPFSEEAAEDREVKRVIAGYPTEFLTLYERITRTNGELTQEDEAKIQRNFTLLINKPENRRAELESSYQIEMSECKNIPEEARKKIMKFWSSVVREFLRQNDYLTCVFVQNLLQSHIKHNRGIYCMEGSFKIDIFQEVTQANQRVNTSSSLFRDVMGQLKLMKDLAFLTVGKVVLKYASIDRPMKINKSDVLKNIWKAYEFLFDWQSPRQAQFQTVIATFRGFYNFNPLKSPMELVENIVKFVDRRRESIEAFRLEIQRNNPIIDQSHQNNAISLLQQVVVRMLLENPLKFSNWSWSLSSLIKNSSSTILQPFKLLFGQRLKLEGLRGKHWRVLMENYLQNPDKLSPDEQQFTINSICSIIAEDSDCFWDEMEIKYVSICIYIRRLHWEQQYSFLSRIILSAMTPHAQSLQSNTIVTLTHFSKKVLQLKADQDVVKLLLGFLCSGNYGSYVSNKLAIIKLFLKVVTYQPTLLVRHFHIINNSEAFKRALSQEIINNLIEDEFRDQLSDTILSALNSILRNKETKHIGVQIINELSGIRDLDFLLGSFLKSETKCEALSEHMIVLMEERQITNNWFDTMLVGCREHFSYVHEADYSQYATVLTKFLLFNSQQANAYDLTVLNLANCVNYLEWVFDMQFEVQSYPVNKLAQASKSIQSPNHRLKLFRCLLRGVQLLNALCVSYLKNEDNKAQRYLPQPLIRHLSLSNNDGAYQLRVDKDKATSYSVGLVSILLTKGAQVQEKLIYSTMALLNKICGDKHQMDISQIYSGRNVAKKYMNLSAALLNHMEENPSQAAMEYMVSNDKFSGASRQKVINQLTLCNKEMCLPVSQYLLSLTSTKPNWHEITQKMDYIRDNFNEIESSLKKKRLTVQKDKRESIGCILQNIGLMLLQLQVSDGQIYVQFIKRYFFFLLDIENVFYNMRSSYYKALQLFFASKGCLSNAQFTSLTKLKEIPLALMVVIDKSLEQLKEASASPEDDSLIFGITLNALQMLNHLIFNSQQFKQYIIRTDTALTKICSYTPRRPIDGGINQILTRVFLKAIGQKILRKVDVEFSNDLSLLHLITVEPDLQIAQMMLSKLKRVEINELIVCILQYIWKCSSTEDFHSQMWSLLMDNLNRAILSKSNCEIIWFCEIMINILHHAIEQPTSHRSAATKIPALLQSKIITDRVGVLLSRFNKAHGLEMKSWFGLNLSLQTKSDLDLFEVSEVLAWFRLFNFAVVYERQEQTDTLSKNLKEQICSMFPLLISILEGKPHYTCESEIEHFLLRASIKDFREKETIEDANESFLKIDNGLELMHQIATMELVASVAMLFDSLYQSEHRLQESNMDKILLICHNLVDKIAALETHYRAAGQTLKDFSERIYHKSIDLMQRMLFTNCSGLTSSLIMNCDKYKTMLEGCLISFLQRYRMSLQSMEKEMNKSLGNYKKKFKILEGQFQKKNLDSEALRAYVKDNQSEYMSVNTRIYSRY